MEKPLIADATDVPAAAGIVRDEPSGGGVPALPAYLISLKITSMLLFRRGGCGAA